MAICKNTHILKAVQPTMLAVPHSGLCLSFKVSRCALPPRLPPRSSWPWARKGFGPRPLGRSLSIQSTGSLLSETLKGDTESYHAGGFVDVVEPVHLWWSPPGGAPSGPYSQLEPNGKPLVCASPLVSRKFGGHDQCSADAAGAVKLIKAACPDAGSQQVCVLHAMYARTFTALDTSGDRMSCLQQ